jgi:hypothetical protein
VAEGHKVQKVQASVNPSGISRSAGIAARRWKEIPETQAMTHLGTGFAPFILCYDLCSTEGGVTTARWWLLGAILLGIAVFVYIVIFCPTECH